MNEMRATSGIEERLRSNAELFVLSLLEGARVWRVSTRTMTIIVTMPIVVAGVGVFSALLGKEAFKWFTGEGRFAENSQVTFYFLAFAMAFFFAWRQHRTGQRVTAILYVGLCLGFVFMIGEEISWGQRLFGWDTPEAIAEINKQDETTLHNIHGVEFIFKWLQMVVGAYGAILPVAIMLWHPRAKWKALVEAIVPHYTLVPYFLPMFIWRLFRNIFEVPDHYYFVVAEFNEVIELILAIGFALFMAFQLRRAPRQKSVDGSLGV